MLLPSLPDILRNTPYCIFWFRRDLRLHDNAGLYHALKSGLPVLPIFIFDTNILKDLPSQDRRVEFIYLAINEIDAELVKYGSSILVLHGKPLVILDELARTTSLKAVYTNHDYESSAITRDRKIAESLSSDGITFKTFKDHVIFEKSEIIKDDGTPYRVFGAYKRKWLQKLNSFYLKPFPTEQYFSNLFQCRQLKGISLEEMGFVPQHIPFPSKALQKEIIQNYTYTRDFPFLEGTSRLGVHLRFGTISIREAAQIAQQSSETWLGEIIWRDFFSMILYHFPHVEHTTFHQDYAAIPWSLNEAHFERWCAGTTGYPLVDAGMRELNATGFMHNRVRMVVASFLVKHLLIDYRWGEAYFAEKLLDYDLASNNGNWQWCAGTGCDAAPYFRVFNPESQAKKFDKQQQYIKRWVPEIGTSAYPSPIVEHSVARERVLQTYKKALNVARGIE